MNKRLEEIKIQLENLKLDSDDFGHSCTKLREYCERELIRWSEDQIPWLINRIENLTKALEFYANGETYTEFRFNNEDNIPYGPSNTAIEFDRGERARKGLRE